MPDTKLIFLDIDGTLVRAGENTPPDSALKAIRAAQAKGNKVFLCTGRNPDMLKPLLKFGFDGYVGAAGGYVVVDDEVIYDQPMTKEDTELALELLHKNGVFCTVEGVDGSWGDENLGEFLAGQGEGNSEIEHHVPEDGAARRSEGRAGGPLRLRGAGRACPRLCERRTYQPRF